MDFTAAQRRLDRPYLIRIGDVVRAREQVRKSRSWCSRTACLEVSRALLVTGRVVYTRALGRNAEDARVKGGLDRIKSNMMRAQSQQSSTGRVCSPSRPSKGSRPLARRLEPRRVTEAPIAVDRKFSVVEHRGPRSLVEPNYIHKLLTVSTPRSATRRAREAIYSLGSCLAASLDHYCSLAF